MKRHETVKMALMIHRLKGGSMVAEKSVEASQEGEVRKCDIELLLLRDAATGPKNKKEECGCKDSFCGRVLQIVTVTAASVTALSSVWMDRGSTCRVAGSHGHICVSKHG